MSELLPTALEKSRKAHSRVLQVLQVPGTQLSLSIAMGVSESTVSRTKGTLEDAFALLYQAGFKVVESSKVCVDRDRFEAMVTIAGAAMSCPQTSRKLIWETEE